MIVSEERIAKYISNWIRNYAEEAGIRTLVVGLSGGVDSALVALLCKKTRMNTVCAFMPCQSSASSRTAALEFAQDYKLTLLDIDLSEAYAKIDTNINLEVPKHRNVKFEMDYKKDGTLRSCLRTPVLSYLCQIYKGIIVGTGNRSEDNLIRYYNKFGDGAVDISPIADLYKSEVFQLFKYLTSGEDIKESAQNIYDATPSADLWGIENPQTDEEELGITYDEIEWVDRENIKNQIISEVTDPVRHKAWGRYTGRQKQIIAKIHQMEKMSKHKLNPNIPTCRLRYIGGMMK